MRDPETKFHLQGIRNPVFRILNSPRRIQNPRLSWITFFITWDDIAFILV